jgi:hypothetical protein
MRAYNCGSFSALSYFSFQYVFITSKLSAFSNSSDKLTNVRSGSSRSSNFPMFISLPSLPYFSNAFFHSASLNLIKLFAGPNLSIGTVSGSGFLMGCPPLPNCLDRPFPLLFLSFGCCHCKLLTFNF